ncbi:tol-pal system protein YbgF [Thalassovita sp.]|jgi:tol-pal system protein YbgF|uniref:tol-pal system protein YbgF n=1 Tax=Thalassovita sp. TaxID=1979401 RepID=UPI003B59C1B1
MRLVFAVIIAAFALPASGMAQDRAQTLADIRQELSVLYVEIQRLKRELSTTGAPSGAGGSSVLARVDAIELAMQGLTAKTEQLEFRINRIVADGTNRIGDLEFRLVELEGGDLSALGETTTLGGDDQSSAVPVATPPGNDGAQLAVGERADFDAAHQALMNGQHADAADKFMAFTEAYPGSPLTSQAHLLRGKALTEMKDAPAAARAFLTAFSTDPQGDDAPEALFLLGQSLATLGQIQDACVTLSEVGVRFPTSASVEPAMVAMEQLDCQ